jgi:thioredoxin
MDKNQSCKTQCKEVCNTSNECCVNNKCDMSKETVRLISELSDVPKSGKVVIDFFADWCGPCKKLGPHFLEFSKEYPNISFLKVNTDNAESLATHYEVSALPTILFIKDGDVISIIKGFNLDKMKSELDELNNS